MLVNQFVNNFYEKNDVAITKIYAPGARKKR